MQTIKVVLVSENESKDALLYGAIQATRQEIGNWSFVDTPQESRGEELLQRHPYCAPLSCRPFSFLSR